MIGRTIGRYSIQKKLGEGGLATVWQAHDDLLGRIVALKILDAKMAQSPEVVRRFLHEGRSTAALSHPGIVAVHDSGVVDGLPFLVLERIEGETLSDRLGRGRLPVPEAVRMAGSVADALAHAHENHVIHRDVTARNIMFARDGRIIVLDFGLALAAWESRLTATGTRMGTAPYIAPEILRGQAASARSDVYSLGVVLYEALTGAVPFASNNAAGLFHRALHDTPAPASERRPDVSPALDASILRALAREPEDRFATMREFAGALAGLGSKAGLDVMITQAGVTPSRPPAHIATGRPDPLYLALFPFTQMPSAAGTDDAATVQLAGRLADTLRARLASRSGVRIVTALPDATVETNDPIAIARSSGANAALHGTVAREGSTLRVCYQIVDADRGVQFAGGLVDGSAFGVFDLEDRVVAHVLHALELDQSAAAEHRTLRGPDPARDEHYEQALASLKRYDNEASVDGAIHQLEQLTASEGATARIHAGLARACLRKYRITKQRVWEARAASELERAIALDADAPEVHLALGDLKSTAGALAPALAEYERVLAAQPNQIDALLGLARTRLAMGDSVAAEQAALAAIAASPGDWRCHNVLGVVRLQAGDSAGTLAPWRRVVELTPDNALGHLNLGTCYYHLDQFEDAAAAYERSLALQPSPTGFSNLGTVLFFLCNYDRAAEAFRKATVLRPADPLLWGNLGNACRWIPGQEAEAASALDRAIDLAAEKLERNPTDFDLWARSAGWLTGRGRVAEARAALDRARAIAPDDLEVIVRAAYVHVDLGEIDQGLSFIRAAVERGYPVTEFRHGAELAPLRGNPEFERILSHGALATPPRRPASDLER